MGRQRVAAILCHRDGMTFAEAEELIQQTVDEMAACNYASDECEDIIMSNLGLELDYIFDLI